MTNADQPDDPYIIRDMETVTAQYTNLSLTLDQVPFFLNIKGPPSLKGVKGRAFVVGLKKSNPLGNALHSAGGGGGSGS